MIVGATKVSAVIAIVAVAVGSPVSVGNDGVRVNDACAAEGTDCVQQRDWICWGPDIEDPIPDYRVLE